jgi:rhamnogalacturonyl hydrolase YesR
MRALRRLRGNVGKLGLKAAGTLWPPNAVVVGRNALDGLRSDPWSEFIARSNRPAATVHLALEQGLGWLEVAQDRSGAGGVASYEFHGWTKGYPEVTGYIIPTLWDCRHALDRPDLADRAVRMADWELGIQRENGGWEGGVEGENQQPIVFNTGQVMRGLLRTHAETGDQRYLDATVRAADWIVGVQDDDGSWTSANYRGLKRVYDSYVSAPLARAGAVTGNEAYAEAATRNCEFVLRQQRESGWFDLCDNSPFFVEAPVTHAIGYTIDGLLETGDLVGRADFIAAATRAAEGVMSAIVPSGSLPGRLDEHWQPRVRWVCLTGSAQIGIVLLKLHERTGEPRYLDAARRLADFLVYVQRLNAVGATRRGALPGSYPIWGTYAPLKYPCWATKYLVDLLVLLERL